MDNLVTVIYAEFLFTFMVFVAGIWLWYTHRRTIKHIQAVKHMLDTTVFVYIEEHHGSFYVYDVETKVFLCQSTSKELAFTNAVYLFPEKQVVLVV